MTAPRANPKVQTIVVENLVRNAKGEWRATSSRTIQKEKEPA